MWGLGFSGFRVLLRLGFGRFAYGWVGFGRFAYGWVGFGVFQRLEVFSG